VYSTMKRTHVSDMLRDWDWVGGATSSAMQPIALTQETSDYNNYRGHCMTSCVRDFSFWDCESR
jgi:hypothetical protein